METEKPTLILRLFKYEEVSDSLLMSKVLEYYVLLALYMTRL